MTTIDSIDPDANKTYHVYHDPESGRDLSTTAIMAVANAAGVEPHELTPRLYEILDPDALDALFEQSAAATTRRRVSFRMSGYDVSVHGDGHIYVTGTDDSP